MVITTATMTVAGGETTGIITVHRTLTSFKPCAETPNQYHRRYPCDQQEGRKVFESADSCHRSSFSIAGRWNCVSSCLDPTRTADLRAVSPLLAAATHIPTVALPTGLSERIALFSFCVKRDCKLRRSALVLECHPTAILSARIRTIIDCCVEKWAAA